MLHGNRAILAIAIVPVLALALAACGSSSDSNSSSMATNANSASTVATKSIPGTGTVLVDSQGAALYTNDMDTGSTVVCTDQCLTEWLPVAAPSGGQPTSADSAVQAKLGTLKRPDGTSQVTFGGMPLYSFVEDPSGQVTGDGFEDDFGGTHFVWTVASVGGSSSGSAGSAAPTTTQSSGGGYGGVGY